MGDGRRGDKRARIIEAAVEVFAEKGFHAARVSDIARRAGVADGTIYLYFKSKEDVLLSIFEEKMSELLVGLLAALEGVSDPLDRIRAYAIYHFQQVQQHRALAEVLQVQMRLSERFIHNYRPEKLWDYLNVFREIIRDGQQAGAIRPEVNPFTVMWAFFGALDQVGVQWVLARRNPRFDLEVAAEEVAQLFIRGVAV